MTIDDIIQDIRNLRDADFHVCPHEQYQDDPSSYFTEHVPACTCEHFDQVIDKLEELKNGK